MPWFDIPKGSCECLSVQDQAGWDFRQLDLVEGVPVHGTGDGTR